MDKSKDYKTDLAKKVKVALVESEMTQAELAKEFGVTRQYLNAVINGKMQSSLLQSKLYSFVGGKYGS